MNRVLVLVDYSEVTAAALSIALQWASGRPDASIIMLHVQPDLNKELQRSLVNAPDGTAIEDGINEAEKAFSAALELEYQRAESAGIRLQRTDAEVIVCGGDWVEVTLNLVDEEKIDLIVAPTHGPQKITERILGTAADQLVTKAPCSVFVVKPKGYPFFTD